MLPLISVIIPCYNAEKYVEQAVRSIMEQTYKKIEIIVVNDCSTDSTGKILKRLAEEDKRILYVENETNLKLSKTLNKGIDLSRGEYIARMDSDDISVIDRLEKQIYFLLNNPDIDLVGSNYQGIDEQQNYTYDSLYPNTHEQIIKRLPLACAFVHPTILAKKSFFTDLSGYKVVNYGEDYELWIRGWLSGKKYHNLPEKLIFYRMHSEQMSSENFSKKNSKSVMAFLFKFFFETKKIRFLIGVLLQTQFAKYVIKKTFSIRRYIKFKFR